MNLRNLTFLAILSISLSVAGANESGKAAQGCSDGCGSCSCSDDCGNSCCESDNGLFSCHCCCLTYDAYVGAVAMRRQNPGDVPFIADPINGDPYFNMSQLNFDYAPGAEGSLVIGLPNQCSFIEARYLGLYEINASATSGPFTVQDINGLDVQYQTTPPTAAFFPQGNTLITADYSSILQSGEVNLGHRLNDRLTLLGGFRYFSLHERFHAHFDFTTALGAPNGTVDYTDQVEDNLYGFQVGTEIAFCKCRNHCFQVTGFIKSGIYGEKAHRSVQIVAVPGSFGAANNSGADNEVAAAFAQEAGVKASYKVTKSITVSAGYQLLFLSHIALASDQLQKTGQLYPTSTNVITTGVDLSGQVLYHGLNAGLEICF